MAIIKAVYYSMKKVLCLSVIIGIFVLGKGSVEMGCR